MVANMLSCLVTFLSIYSVTSFKSAPSTMKRFAQKLDAYHDDLADITKLLRSAHTQSTQNYGQLQGKIIRYRITRYPHWTRDTLTDERSYKEYINTAVRDAVKLWGEVIDVNFIYWPYKQADIEVSFASLEHDDQYPFDGPGGEVAHAFYPIHKTRSGQIHIDEQEPWGPSGRNLNWVLVHEIGHALGLPHTSHESIMRPQYQGFGINEPSLSLYDIVSIQAIYGKRKSFDDIMLNKLAFVKSRTSNDNIVPTLCDKTSIDTLFALPNGTVFVFKDEYFWRISNNITEPNVGPLPINKFWGSVQTPVNAAFTDQFDWTWFVKDDLIWRIDASGETFRYSAPQNIFDIEPFANFPYQTIDSVLIILDDNESQPAFIFLGQKYWYGKNTKQGSNKNYSDRLRNIDINLKRVDGAVSLESGNFIFSNDLYWKVQKIGDSHLKKEEGYPRSISEDWFRCS